jgi:membrane protein involved in D-alanine export
MVAGGFVLAALVRLSHAGTAGTAVVSKAVTLFFLGPWSFYWTIAGAFLFLASLGELHGLHVGPSFDRPFFQTNIADFWARWNMTATTVFRELLFYNRWGLRRFHPYVNTMLVFLAVGLWHGSNLYWISFGLLHGAYFCSFLWFRSWSGRPRFSRWAGTLLTYFCVCTAWYLPSKFVGLVYR